MRLPLCLLTVAAIMLNHSALQADSPKPEKAWVFLGTYTGATSKGIYRCEMDLTTGKLSEPKLAAEVATPSFLAVHPSRKILYAVGELEEFAKKKQGAVYAFALDP